MRVEFARFAPPRHPLARLALGLAGLLLLGLLSAFGLALAAVALIGLAGRAAWLRLRGGPPRAGASHDPQVIEGEFKVVDPARLPPR